MPNDSVFVKIIELMGVLIGNSVWNGSLVIINKEIRHKDGNILAFDTILVISKQFFYVIADIAHLHGIVSAHLQWDIYFLSTLQIKNETQGTSNSF